MILQLTNSSGHFFLDVYVNPRICIWYNICTYKSNLKYQLNTTFFHLGCLEENKSFQNQCSFLSYYYHQYFIAPRSRKLIIIYCRNILFPEGRSSNLKCFISYLVPLLLLYYFLPTQFSVQMNDNYQCTVTDTSCHYACFNLQNHSLVLLLVLP